MKSNINIFRLSIEIFTCKSELILRPPKSKNHKYTCVYGYEYIGDYVRFMFKHLFLLNILIICSSNVSSSCLLIIIEYKPKPKHTTNTKPIPTPELNPKLNPVLRSYETHTYISLQPECGKLYTIDINMQ